MEPIRSKTGLCSNDKTLEQIILILWTTKDATYLIKKKDLHVDIVLFNTRDYK
jgi:hypothetical protein